MRGACPLPQLMPNDYVLAMSKNKYFDTSAIVTPPAIEPQAFTKAEDVVAALQALYSRNTHFLREHFENVGRGNAPAGRIRAFYPELRLTTRSFAQVDSRIAYGHVSSPGDYSTTITRPDLFTHYLTEQLRLLLKNHDVPVTVCESATPIPLHFAFLEGTHVDQSVAEAFTRPLRDIFDVPDLADTDDRIVNGTFEDRPGQPLPLAPFTAQRIDYSLHRLAHYTATSPAHFQNFVIFTNYQFYMDEFTAMAKALMAEGGGGYDAFVEPGHVTTLAGERSPSSGTAPDRLPQMPAYHLVKNTAKGMSGGITMINIGVGPSNAKTITDHVAVLRPHAWLMLGHCAGLRNTQELGDYVLAHAYVREDHVLDADLPVWIPIPALAEVQVALEDAVEEVTGLEG